jgi:MFS family permease
VFRGVVNAFGVFQTYYERNILSDYPPSSIAWIGSIQAFLLLTVGSITGPLFDAGYFRFLLLFGWLMLPFGLMMTSISTEFWHVMLAHGICAGLGSGSLFVPSVAILPQYFKKRRGLANGLAASGSSIGGLIYPILFHQLEIRIGFPWATRVLGFVALGTISISLALMRARVFPEEKRALIQIDAFKELPYSLFCFALFVAFCGFYNLLFFIQSYAIENHIMGENLAFYLLSMLNAASTFGRVLPNFIADYTGPLNVFIPALSSTALLAYVWIAIRNTPGVIALCVLYGFSSGGFVSLPPVILMTLTRDIRDFGTRLGMSFAVCSVGVLIGAPIGGALISRMQGDFLGVQLFAGSCIVTGAVTAIFLRFYKTGPTLFIRA